jgi:hypothetical protein
MSNQGDVGLPDPTQPVAAGVSEPPPQSVRRARTYLYVQGGFGVLAAVLGVVLILIGSGSAGGVVLVLGLLQAAISLFFATRIAPGRSGVRTAIIVWESVIVAVQLLSVVLTLASGSTSGIGGTVVGLLIAVVVLRYVLRGDATAWFQAP